MEEELLVCLTVDNCKKSKKTNNLLLINENIKK